MPAVCRSYRPLPEECPTSSTTGVPGCWCRSMIIRGWRWQRCVCWSRQWQASEWQRRLQALPGEQQFGRDLATAIETGSALGEILAMPGALFRKGPQRADGIRIMKRAAAR